MPSVARSEICKIGLRTLWKQGSLCGKPQGRAGQLQQRFSLSQKAGRGFECQSGFPTSGVQQAASDLRRACSLPPPRRNCSR